MLDVLLSIRPSWCKKILSREKSVELRKSRPHTEKPFRVYLYETRAGRGAVVGECICWFVEKAVQGPYSLTMVEGSLLYSDDIAAYAKRKPIYGWYMSNVTEYKTLRPLSDFGLQRAPQSWCYIKEVA